MKSSSETPPSLPSSRYQVLTLGTGSPDTVTRVVLDNNVLLDTRAWFDGRDKNPAATAELWAWLRQVGKRGRRAGGTREAGIPISFPGLIEAAWSPGGKVDRDKAKYLVACVAEAANWDAGTFRNRSDLRRNHLPKQISQTTKNYVDRQFGTTDLDEYRREFSGDWASILLLLPFLPRAEALSSPRARLALRDEWIELRYSRGATCSAEVSFLATFVFFGGGQLIVVGGKKKRFTARDLLKYSEWNRHGLSRTARNVAFDLRVLKMWRESSISDPAGLGPQPTALVTGDQGLAALHGLVQEIYANPERPAGLTTEPLGAIIASTPEGSLVEAWLADLPVEVAQQLRAGSTRTYVPHLSADELLAVMPNWADEASRALGIKGFTEVGA